MAVDLFANPLQAPDDAARDRIINAVCAVNGYQAQVPDPADPTKTIPNPVGKRAFAKDHVKSYLRATVQAYERSQAALAAAPDVT